MSFGPETLDPNLAAPVKRLVEEQLANRFRQAKNPPVVSRPTPITIPDSNVKDTISNTNPNPKRNWKNDPAKQFKVIGERLKEMVKYLITTVKPKDNEEVPNFQKI